MYNSNALLIYIDSVVNATLATFFNTTSGIMIGTAMAMTLFINGRMWFNDVYIYNHTSLWSTDIINTIFYWCIIHLKIKHRIMVAFMEVIAMVRFVQWVLVLQLSFCPTVQQEHSVCNALHWVLVERARVYVISTNVRQQQTKEWCLFL